MSNKFSRRAGLVGGANTVGVFIRDLNCAASRTASGQSVSMSGLKPVAISEEEDAD
jgi:hypothetical protein